MKRIVLLALFASSAFWIDGQDKGKPSYPSFRDAEVRLILDFYRPGAGKLPAKRGDLPPGLEKHLRRGGSLPPGLENQIRPFPNDLARLLPPVPTGYRRVVCGTTALLIQDAANLIVDIVELVKR